MATTMEIPVVAYSFDLQSFPTCVQVLAFQGSGGSKQESGNTNNSGNHGVVNYNFYNTQYQNSIDMSHLMEQANTAYGHSGGTTDASRGDSTNSSSSVTNLLASGAQLAAGILPLLADGLTEDFENSDRVDVRQAGATTLATQHTAGIAGYVNKGKQCEPSSTADEGYGPGPAVQRYVTWKIGEWTAQMNRYTGWFVPLPYTMLQRNVPATALARRHYTFNSGFKVHVQVNSTRFHGGALGVFMAPQYVNQNQTSLEPGNLAQNSDQNFQQLFLYPHQILNPRTNSSCDVEVPYAHFSPAVAPSQCAPWTLIIMVLENLQYATGATTSLEVYVSVQPTNPTFHGIRQTDTRFQGLPKADLDSSTYAWASTEPHTAEPDYGCVVRSSPHYLPAKFDDLLQIARIPTLCHNASFQVQQVPSNDPVYSLNASLAATDLANTSLETTSRGFAQYRGSIVLRFVFTGNQMQNTRILAAYTPPGADAPTDPETAANGVYAIFDTGLNSAFEFVVPYISPYDFRLCNGVGEDDLSSGGYVTIWQLTTLACPPGSPPTANFLVFASAGQDFEFRLPTAPVVAFQGEGPVAPAETGHTPEHDASDSNENPNPIPHIEKRFSHSSLRFWFDRYFFSCQVRVPGTSATASNVPLDWKSLTNNIPEVRWFMHATYFRFELEIALMPVGPTAQLGFHAAYYPYGAKIPDGVWTPLQIDGSAGSTPQREAIQRSGASPHWFWNPNVTPVFTTRIPFTSPQTVLVSTHSGYPDWSHTNFARSPLGNNLGTLTFMSTSTTLSSTSTLYLYIRLVDLEAWCPRPGQYLEVPETAARSLGATNFSLLKLCGDVEQNPGPTILTKFFLGDATCAALGQLENFSQIFKKILDYEAWLDKIENEFKDKVIEKFFKFIGYAILAVKCKKDPSLVASVALICGGDWFAKMFKWVYKWLQDELKTPPPPIPGDAPTPPPRKNKPPTPAPRNLSIRSGDVPQLKDESDDELLGSTCAEYPDDLNPFANEQDVFDKIKSFFSSSKLRFQGPLQDANAFIQLCKHSEWIADKFRQILDWLGVWRRQEIDGSVEMWNEKMKKFPDMIEKYEQCKSFPASDQWQECKTYFDEMRRLAVLHDRRLLTLFPNMSKPEHQNSRQEPILVVLRGPPGQGKSVAATLLAQMLAFKSSGKPDYYSYNSSTRFFDGYQQQPVVVIDDLGQNPAAEDFSLFCQMISTTPFQVNMADLRDKGTLFHSHFIIATTNLPTFRPVTISDPGALERRINFDLTVEAGPAFRTPKATLDLDRALQPTGCACTLPFVKKDLNIFSSSCLKFRDTRKTEMSLMELYEKIITLHEGRNDVLTRLQDVFSFQGPVPAPSQSEVKRWAKLCKDQERQFLTTDDILVLQTLEQMCDNHFLREYIGKFYFPEKRRPMKLPKLEVCIQVMTLVLMVLSAGTLVWTIFSMQGPYSGNAEKRKVDKKQGLKIVDIAQFQGPANHDLEVSLLKKNTVVLKCRNETQKFDTNALALGRRVVVMNYHLWERATTIEFDSGPIAKHNIPSVRIAVGGEPSELVFLNFGPFPGREYRDISGLFPTKNQLRIPVGAKVTGIIANRQTPFIFYAQALGVVQRLRTWESSVPLVLRYRADTAPGDCGAPMVVDVGVWKKVCGIHCAGGHGIGAAAILTSEMVRQVLDTPDFQGRIHSVKQHPFVYTPRKTQLYPTVACDDQTSVEPAPLSIADPRLDNPLEFKKNIMAKHTGDRTDGPMCMIRAARNYARTVRAKCGDVVGNLTVEEAVFGTENLDPMDQTRSPGWPYLASGKRRPDLLWKEGDTVHVDTVLGAELALYSQGKFDNHKFVTFLKDELRDKEKVKAGKTRCIDIASYGHAIMGRVLFGRLAAAMHQNNGVELGSAVGCNPDIDWFRYANEFDKKWFVDIDYSGFDSTHTTFSFYCLKIFLQELGFGPVHMAYVDSLCNSTHIWDDEEFQIQGGLPSGCSMTSIFNTIMNNIVVRAILPLVLEEGSEFKILAYGDDLVINTEQKFDTSLYKLLMESLTNYKITPASKSGDFNFGGIEDIVFLKRWWVRDGLLWRPVMSYQNLHNLLSWARAGTVNEKLQSVARLVQHRGANDYKKLLQPFEDCGYHVPSFEDLELEFFSLFFG